MMLQLCAAVLLNGALVHGHGFVESYPSCSFRSAFCRQNSAGMALNTQAISFQKVVEIEPKTPGFGILEGPVWLGGALMMSSIGYATDDNAHPGDLVELRNGKVSTLRAGYGSNGLTLDNNKQLVAARHFDGSITKVNNGQVVASSYNGARFNSPNDLVYSSTGHVYFSDPDWQAPKAKPQAKERAYHVSPNGVVTAFGDEITKPNGVMLGLMEDVLYVGGTNGIYKYTISPNGSPTGGRKITSITSGVDGMSKDCAGNIWVVADGKLYVVSKDDAVIGQYAITGLTNVAFGGPDGKTIYATTLGEKPTVLSASTNVPGFPF